MVNIYYWQHIRRHHNIATKPTTFKYCAFENNDKEKWLEPTYKNENIYLFECYVLRNYSDFEEQHNVENLQVTTKPTVLKYITPL